jgi:murein DD-endopeptidase MepM/ murein hydrolase activator NlpD
MAPILIALAGCAGASASAPEVTLPLLAPDVPPPAIVPQPPVRHDFGLTGSLLQGGLMRGRTPAGTAALTLDGREVPLAPDGRFLLGFDRDQVSNAVLTARTRDGRVLQQPLNIAARTWRIEHVDVAQRPMQSTEEFLRIREGELARIRAARALRSQSSGWQQAFIWPARGRISGVFGSQRVYRGEPGAYHSGVDVAAGAGAPVVAPADGVVVLSGPPSFSLEGNLVIIDHGMGLNSAFLHMATSRVSVGESVRQGQAIGTVGATGRATGPHLHWSLTWNGARLDPQLAAVSVAP